MTTIPAITLNDGRTIPQFGLGVFLMDPGETERVVSEALELGYRHIDTAAIYGNEAEVGAAIAKSGIPRDELYVTTKLWNSRQTDAHVAMRESLDKLGLDHVDLYLIHWPTPEKGTYVGAWLDLEEIQAQGLATSIGVSNFMPEHLDALLAQGSVVPAVNQIEVHPTLQQRDAVAANQRHGIVTEAWSPLGRGKADDLTSPVVTAIADAVGRTPAQVVLRWHVQQGYVVFPKSSRRERLAENMRIFDFALTDDQVAALDSLEAGTRVGPDPRTFN